MKYFSTNSMTVTTVRREDYYPSRRVADFLAKRICYVLERDADSHLASCYLNGSTKAGRLIEDRWTPAEFQVILGFLEWWSLGGAAAAQKAFVCVNLNRGWSLCVVSRKEIRDRDDHL